MPENMNAGVKDTSVHTLFFSVNNMTTPVTPRFLCLPLLWIKKKVNVTKSSFETVTYLFLYVLSAKAM